MIYQSLRPADVNAMKGRMLAEQIEPNSGEDAEYQNG
jgi:hypothetical protein